MEVENVEIWDFWSIRISETIRDDLLRSLQWMVVNTVFKCPPITVMIEAIRKLILSVFYARQQNDSRVLAIV